MNDHNLNCECSECNEVWDKLSKETDTELEFGVCEEFDDECEAEMDSLFDRDGW